MSWQLLDSSPSNGRTYARPISINEASFYWDRLFNGTADIIWHYLVKESDRAKGTNLFSEQNLKRTWATLKQWYPLLGVRLDDSCGGDAINFVVSERYLADHHPDEVVLSTVSSPAEVEATISSLTSEKPMQDHHLIARLLIFAHGNSPGTYEILFRVSHMIADGISGATIARTFFDVLTSPPVGTPPLEERLAMALPYVELNPARKMSLARQRWRKATAKIIFLIRRRRLAGGHTIPRTVTEETYRTPSATARAGYRFSLSESTAILAACKKHRVTVGTVIAVVSQLAITRMLHRRYLRGDISLDDWEYRRRQPMHFGGPFNLRPYMDPEWQRKGGATELQLAIDFYECTLPFMPTPFGTRRDEGVPRGADGAPPYAVLMSSARFFYRTQLFRTQLQRIVRNPLILEIAAERQLSYRLRKKVIAKRWMADQKGEPLPDMPMPPDWESVPADFVPSNGLSSVGQMSLIIPEKYPLPPDHPLSIRTPRASDSKYSAVSETPASDALVDALAVTSDADALLRIVDTPRTILHSRPLECFLGNATDFGRIGMTLMYDRNVYSKEDAEEFILECREAMLHYLGGEVAVKAKL